MSLEIGFMLLIIGLERLLGWESLLLFGRYDYVEMTKCLMVKTLLSCRSFIGVLVRFGRFFSEWRIETCLWRSVHS
jgi:hypothetical protein